MYMTCMFNEYTVNLYFELNCACSNEEMENNGKGKTTRSRSSSSE